MNLDSVLDWGRGREGGSEEGLDLRPLGVPESRENFARRMQIVPVVEMLALSSSLDRGLSLLAVVGCNEFSGSEGAEDSGEEREIAIAINIRSSSRTTSLKLNPRAVISRIKCTARAWQLWGNEGLC